MSIATHMPYFILFRKMNEVILFARYTTDCAGKLNVSDLLKILQNRASR